MDAPAAIRLEAFDPVDVPELMQVLDAAWGLPGCAVASARVPNVAPSRLPRGIDALSTAARKETFVRSVLPHVLDVNAAIRRDRGLVLESLRWVEAGNELDPVRGDRLRSLSRKYRLDWNADAAAAGEFARLAAELLLRVDEIPPSLALAQGAMESAWGTSRFAVEGNSLFGQWVFSSRGGMAPKDRPDGARYSVARFDSLRASVAAYMRNLNTSWAYADLRAARARMRDAEQPLDSSLLAEDLLLYSVRREAYVQEIQTLIRGNRFTRYDSARICSVRLTAVHRSGTPAQRRVASSAAGGVLPPDA